MEHSSDFLTRLILKEKKAYKKGQILFQIYKHDKAQRGKGFPKVTQQDCGRAGIKFTHSKSSLRHNSLRYDSPGKTFHTSPAYPNLDKPCLFENMHIRHLGFCHRSKFCHRSGSRCLWKQISALK